MNFKKTILLLSLSAASTFAAAAPDAPAPAAASAPNLLRGAPAYVPTTNNWIWDFTAYSPLLDDDRVHPGGIGQGAWTNFTTNPAIYVVDIGGAPCTDRFGSCPGTPGTGATDMNTVVVYFEQAPGAEQEPSGTTLANAEMVDLVVHGYKGSKPGVNWDVLDEKAWVSLGEIKYNKLAKRTFSFPTGKYSKIKVSAKQKYADATPVLVHVEAFNLPATAATEPSLLQGAPAYVYTAGGPGWGFTAYSPLMDDDRVHAGGIGEGAWTGFTTEPTTYAIDFDGSPCADKFGSCAGKPGKGATDVNTVVVYFEQAPGTEQEPTDATQADKKISSVKLRGYTGQSPGMSEAVVEEGSWSPLGSIEGNTLAKRAFTFPTGKYSKFQITVRNSDGSTHTPRLAHVDAFNLPAAPAPAQP